MDSLNRGKSIVDVALAGGEIVSDLLIDLKEKAVLLADARTDVQKQIIIEDYNAILSQIDSVVDNAEFAGMNLLKSEGFNIDESTFTQAIIPTEIVGSTSGYSTKSYEHSLAVSDFDNDGDVDIALTATPSRLNGAAPLLQKHELFSNDGGGTYSSAQVISYTSPGTTGTAEVDFADLNVDGNQDLVIIDNTGLAVFLGNGSGTFSTTPDFRDSSFNPFSRTAIADFNNDSIPDIFTNEGGSKIYHEGVGDGSFLAEVLIQLGSGHGLITSDDVNNDGNPDYIKLGGNVEIGTGNGDGTFSFLPSVTLSVGNGVSPGIAAGDINGDGFVDLAAPRADSDPNNNKITILLGNGDGSFGLETHYVAGDLRTGVGAQYVLGQNILVTDLNNDGLDEVIVANYADDMVAIYQGNEDGTLKNPINIATGGKPVALAIADVTGNGYQDILSVSHEDGNITILMNSGLGAPSEKTPEFVVPTSAKSNIVVSREPMTTNNLSLRKIDFVTNVSGLIQAVTEQIETVSLSLARLGASARQLDIALELNIKKTDALASGLGNLVDTDMAKDSAILQALQIKQQLGTKALGIANQMPNMLLTLFKR